MKVLQFGDVHAEDGPKFPEIEKCLMHIVEQAEAEQPDLIICTGDTTNSRECKLDSMASKLIFRAFSRLADVAPVVVDIGTPSHDGTAVEVLQYVRGKYPVCVYKAPGQDVFGCANSDEYIVASCIPAPTKQFMQGDTIEGGDAQISAAMSAMFSGFGATAPDNFPHILVGHWATVGSRINGQDYIGKEISIGYDQMMLAQPDLVCLGHIHEAQQIGDRVFYNGSIYQKDYGEMSDKGFWIHEFDGKRLASSRFEKTPSRRLCRIEVNACDCFKAWPTDADSIRGSGCNVRLEITCWQDEAANINSHAMAWSLQRAGAVDVDVRLIRVPRQTVRADIVLQARTLREKLVAMAELRGEAVPESILSKADALEAYSPDEMIQVVAGGVGSLPLEREAA